MLVFILMGELFSVFQCSIFPIVPSLIFIPYLSFLFFLFHSSGHSHISCSNWNKSWMGFWRWLAWPWSCRLLEQGPSCWYDGKWIDRYELQTHILGNNMMLTPRRCLFPNIEQVGGSTVATRPKKLLTKLNQAFAALKSFLGDIKDSLSACLSINSTFTWEPFLPPSSHFYQSLLFQFTGENGCNWQTTKHLYRCEEHCCCTDLF